MKQVQKTREEEEEEEEEERDITEGASKPNVSESTTEQNGRKEWNA
jgi:hypothetical protein